MMSYVMNRDPILIDFINKDAAWIRLEPESLQQICSQLNSEQLYGLAGFLFPLSLFKFTFVNK